MTTVTVKASRKYDVIIGKDLINEIGGLLSQLRPGRRVMLVSDDNVFPLYGGTVKNSLESEGFEVTAFIIPHGEKSKSLFKYTEILEAMNAAHIGRDDTVAALGGGVVGDLSGFVAATYQRGTGFIQLPTSLLAAVDSSVGGKTAVNLEHAKNQVGCFYQPKLVVCDTDTLSTLPEREYRNGCAEIIKYGMIADEELFNMLSVKPVKDNYEETISRCVSIKRDFVQADEFDTGKRMLLNFGHTFGHAVEACSGYNVAHGEAVAIGMTAITKAASAKDFCAEETVRRLEELVRAYGLPDTVDYMAGEMAEAILSDKKNISDRVRLIVPRSVGNCEIKEVGSDELDSWLKLGGAR